MRAPTRTGGPPPSARRSSTSSRAASTSAPRPGQINNKQYINKHVANKEGEFGAEARPTAAAVLQGLGALQSPAAVLGLAAFAI